MSVHGSEIVDDLNLDDPALEINGSDTTEGPPAARLIYWKLNARGTPAILVAALGNVPLNWDNEVADTWPTPKEGTPFGELPVLHDGDLVIAESMALTRYLAKKGGVDCFRAGSFEEVLASFGISEMITEKGVDMFQDLISNKFSDEPVAAYTDFFGVRLVLHFRQLERLLVHDFFSGDTPLQGDAVLFGFLHIISCCNATRTDAAIAEFPKMSAWRTRFAELPAISKVMKDVLGNVSPYFFWPEVDL